MHDTTGRCLGVPGRNLDTSQARWARHRHSTTATVATSPSRYHSHGGCRRNSGHVTGTVGTSPSRYLGTTARGAQRASAAKRFDNVLFMKSTGSVALGLNFLHVSDKPVLCCISSHMGAFSSDCRLSLLRRPNTSCSSPGGGIGY